MLDVEIGFAVEMYAAFVGVKCLVVAERRSGCKPDVGAIGHRYVHDRRVGIEVSDRREHQGGTPCEHTGQGHDCDDRSRSEQECIRMCPKRFERRWGRCTVQGAFSSASIRLLSRLSERMKRAGP